MGIKITNNVSKMPEALKLASHISSFLFEQEYGECQHMSLAEIESVRKASRALIRASNRTCKKK